MDTSEAIKKAVACVESSWLRDKETIILALRDFDESLKHDIGVYEENRKLKAENKRLKKELSWYENMSAEDVADLIAGM